jgi:hypothetical protein
MNRCRNCLFRKFIHSLAVMIHLCLALSAPNRWIFELVQSASCSSKMRTDKYLWREARRKNRISMDVSEIWTVWWAMPQNRSWKHEQRKEPAIKFWIYHQRFENEKILNQEIFSDLSQTKSSVKGKSIKVFTFKDSIDLIFAFWWVFEEEDPLPVPGFNSFWQL